MAFFSKVGNILRQTASKQISADLSASRPSIYQAIRCMSSSKVFIGGLSYATDDQSLREAFGKYGEVTEARVIMDRETGKSRGFGFVSYTSSEEASSAIQALDGQELHGRRVRVNYAVQRSGPPPSQYGYPGAYNTGGGNYGSGYGAPGGNYGGNAGYGGGNYSGSGGGQGSGGNYGSNYGGDSYGNGGGGSYGGSNVSYGGAGNYAGGNTHDGGNSGAYGSSGGNYGVAGGIGGSDNHVSSGPAGGYDGSTGLGYGGGDQLGSNESGSMGDPAEGNYRDDDDDTNDFAKRA